MTSKSDATWIETNLPAWQETPPTPEEWQRIGDLAARLAGRNDQRMVARLIRIRLYRAGTDDPMADTSPDLPPDSYGDWQVPGLTAIPDALINIAAGFHAPLTITGLDSLALTGRIKGLRPTLSRRGGTATFRAAYEVGGDTWLARVDIKTL